MLDLVFYDPEVDVFWIANGISDKELEVKHLTKIMGWHYMCEL